MKHGLDSIRLEILWRRLISIVDEADATVMRTAFSSLLRDAHDYTCALFSPEGQLVAQATLTTPGQLGGMALGIREVCRRIPPDRLQPGDVWITNDPWLMAGHLPDILALSPIYRRDRLVAFAACVFHQTDIGGRLGSENREVFEEGLFIPLCKLYDGGALNETALEFIRANVRLPEMVACDLRSQVAANETLDRRLARLLDDEGMDDIAELSGQIIGRTEDSMRKALKGLPAGTYRSEYLIERPGGDEPIVIRAAVTIQGGDAHVDFTGSSAQVERGINCVLNFTYAYVFYAFKAILLPWIPNNDGVVRPITVEAPVGSILNPRFPAAVNGRTSIGHLLSEVVFQALASAIPDKVFAGSGSAPAWWKVIVGRQQNGIPFSKTTLYSGGMGATAGRDGRSCTPFPHNCFGEPIEVLEAEAPLLTRRKVFIPDSGGIGQWRGGCGQEIEFVVRDDETRPQGPLVVALVAGRFRRPAEGALGGGAGQRGQMELNGESRMWGEPLAARAGDRLRFVYPGGGGFGDAKRREPRLVERDVRDGFVTVQGARESYGVAVDPITLRFDAAETARLRGGERTVAEERAP
jgi:N-methylhydantoinase B